MKRRAVSDSSARIGRAIQIFNVFSGAARNVAAMQRSITALVNQASELATSPADLVQTIFGAVTGIKDATSNAADAFHVYSVLPDQLEPTIDDRGDPFAAASARNESETLRIARYAAAVGGARAAVEVDWASHEDAIEARQGMLDEIDALQLEAPDSVFRYLEDVRNLVTQGLPPRDRNLPHIGTIVPEATVTALQLVYRLYGSLTRYDDTVSRNHLQHPAYAPGGVPLEVLVG